ncbi:MAG: hypothetical protein ACOZNI_28655 [Myxococcota bacterium]
MTTKPAIPRDHVHALSEECAKLGMGFQTSAKRMLEDQSRLLRFFKANLPDMEGQTGEVSLYLLAVIVRIFQQTGKLGRVGADDVVKATKRIEGVAAKLLPADDAFPDRVRAVEWRAQPHILDEAMHALFEREERQANEVDLGRDQAVRVFLMLWAATEALEGVWTPPAEPEWASAT